MARQAVVCVGEVPEVISNNPAPEHIRPQHILALVFVCHFTDADSEPASYGDGVKYTGNPVHVVPGTTDIVFNLVI